MQIKALKLKDRKFDNWKTEVENHWNYNDFLANKAWRKDWISFDCCCYLPETDRVYCGITSFDADIFRAYDRPSGKFVDCGFRRIANPYDAKFHRALTRWNEDGCLYAAIALLHDIDHYWDAPGGAIVRYNPLTGDIAKLAIPIPHHYIQSICLAQATGIIYGITFTPEKLFSFDIRTGKSYDLGPLGSGYVMGQGENVEIDGEGCVWSGWGITRAWQSSPGPDSHRLCKYDPEKQKIIYFNSGLPNPDGSYGFTRVEGIFNLGDGNMYASGGNGSLYRIDRQSGKAVYLFTPIANRRSRLAALALGPDGCAYGVTGRDGKCELLRFDFRKSKYELLGAVRDDKTGEPCWQIHDVVFSRDGVLYAGENDNPSRSSYLWEIEL